MGGNLLTSQNCSFDTLILSNNVGGARTHTFGSGRTCTINDSIQISPGLCATPHTIEASSSGNATISKSSGAVVASYVHLNSMTGTGGATFTANNVVSHDGNNVGWAVNASASIDYYWIGGTGNWNDPTKWSLTSGGTPLAANGCIPSSIDNVYFDASSFSASSQTITINVAAECKNMDWTGSTNNPTLAGSSSLTINGNLRLISAMTFSHSGTKYFKGDTVHFGGVSTFNGTVYFQGTDTMQIYPQGVSSQYNYYTTYFQGTGPYYMNGAISIARLEVESGNFYMSDSLVCDGNLNIEQDTFLTNNHTIRCKEFRISGSGSGYINFGTSRIYADYSPSSYSGGSNKGTVYLNNTNFGVNASQATFYLTGSDDVVFRSKLGAGELTVGNLHFSTGSNGYVDCDSRTIFKNIYMSNSTLWLFAGNYSSVDSIFHTGTGWCRLYDNYDTIGYVSTMSTSTGLISGRHQINRMICSSAGLSVYGIDAWIGYARVGGNLATTQNCSFDTLILTREGVETSHNFGAGKTCTIKDSVSVASNGCFQAKLQSNSSGSAATISMPSGKSFIADFVQVKDLTGTGGGTFNAGGNSNDLGGNTGWSFTGTTYTLKAKYTDYCIGDGFTQAVKAVPDGVATAYWWREPGSSDTFNTNIDTIMVNKADTFIFVTEYGSNCTTEDSLAISIAAAASGTAQTYSHSDDFNDWFTCANWSVGSIPDSISDASVPSGKTLSVSTDTAYCKDLTITGTFNLSGGVLVIYGTLTNNGTFNHTGGTVIFRGSASDSINGSASMTLQTVIMDRTAALVLDNKLYIQTSFTFTRGLLITNASDSFCFLTTATSSSNVSSYANGPVYKIGESAFVFPTGKNGWWARIGISAPSSSGSSIFRAQYFRATYSDTSNYTSPILRGSKREYWLLDRISGSGSVRVTLYYEHVDSSGISDTSYIKVIRYNGSSWENEGDFSITHNGTSGSATSDYVSTFSPFAFGTTNNANPVPVELIHFDAIALPEREVQLDWATASEIDNSHFEVERSLDGTDFHKIGRVTGIGNSSQVQRYHYMDRDIDQQVKKTYYRLRQVDFNGNFEYSDVRTVQFDDVYPGNKLGVYPNPATRKLYIRSTEDEIQIYEIELRDLKGQLKYSETSETGHNGLVKEIDLESLKSGMYILTIKNEQKTNHFKILKK